MNDPQEKIFCIGLPKTGTRSICEALRILDYKTIHYPKPLGAILGYEAAGDISVAVNWKFLNQVYPCSTFILTLRDTKTWHRSTSRHFAEYADMAMDGKNCVRSCITRHQINNSHGLGDSKGETKQIKKKS